MPLHQQPLAKFLGLAHRQTVFMAVIALLFKIQRMQSRNGKIIKLKDLLVIIQTI